MRILLIIFLSFFAFGDDHDAMYQEVNAVYLYCSVDEDLSDAKAEKMWEKWVAAYKEMAESLDDEVGSVMLFPFNTNEEMRGGDDMFFVTHAPTMAALAEHQVAMWNLMNDDNKFPESPLNCENQSEAFQRVGPGTAEAPYDFFAVDYWPCKYTEDADPVALRKAQAEFAMEHYANGAEGGFRFIYPTSGGPRGDAPDFWISAAAPGLAARGKNIDIFRAKSYGSEAERERWNHMTCDRSSTWTGWPLHN